MNLLLRILNRNKFYFICFGAFFLIAIVFCCSYTKSSNFIALNFVHTHNLDFFFTFYTFLGDGSLAIIIVLLLVLIRRYLAALHVLVAFLTSGIIAQIIKNLSHAPRPRAFFKPDTYSYFIDGVTQSGWSSFPSGHTTTAFALATILALHSRNKAWSLFYLLLALGEAYSRVYLGQHFLEDVVAGSLIGVFFAIGTFFLVRQVKLFRWNIAGDPASSIMAIQ